MDSLSADDDSQVVDLFLLEFAFGRSEEVGFFFQFVQYLVDDLPVSRQIVIGGDEDIVHIDEQFVWVLHLHFPEHSVHHSLEGGGGVS